MPTWDIIIASLISPLSHLQLGVSSSYALWAVSHTFPLFILARIVAGASKGNIGISSAVVIDVTDVERRNRGMVSVYRKPGNFFCEYRGNCHLL